MKKPMLLFILSFYLNIFSEEFIVTEYKNEYKLANQTFYDGVEGRDGKLYFLARNELISYDGIKFQSLISINPNSIINTDIIRDDSNNVWFTSGGKEKLLIKFDGKAFAEILLPPKIVNLPAPTVSNGNIFLAAESGSIFSYKNGGWKEFNLPGMLSEAEINKIKVIEEKLFVSSSSGMGVYNDLSLSSFSAITTEPVYSFCYDEENKTVYGLMNKSIGLYKEEMFHLIPNNIPVDSQNSPSRYINKISEDTFTFGSGSFHHLYNKKDRTFTRIDLKYGIKASKSTNSFRDKFDNFWITSSIGITKVTKPLFKTLTSKDGLTESDVTAIGHFNNGDKILGHKKGMTLIRGNEIIKIPVTGIDDSQRPHIMDILVDAGQRVWFLIQRQGIGRIDDINRPAKVKWFRDDSFLTMLLLKNNEIFAASGRAFFTIKDDKVSEVFNLNLDKTQYFRRIIELSDSMLAIAGGGGLYLYDISNNNIVKKVDDVKNLYAVSTYKDFLLTGGKSGLYEVRDDKVKRFTGFGKDFAAEEVYFINRLPGKERLWIGTKNGLYKWRDHKLKHFQISDGLADKETNRSAFVFDERTGEVWIGTMGGLSVYKGESDFKNKTKPILTIDKVLVNNETYESLVKELESYDGDIVVNFSGVSLYNNPQVKYRLKLVSADNSYSRDFVTSENTISFEYLPNDSYSLNISAFDRFGNESDIQVVAFAVKRNNLTKVIITFFSVMFLSAFVYFVVVKKRKSNTKNEAPTALADAHNFSYHINLFGSFTILSKDIQPVMNKFSPRSQELLILLLVHSFKGYNLIKGITSEKINKLLWIDSSKQSSKNKRNVTIKRLREPLSEMQLGEIVYENNRWLLNLNSSVSLDYIEWLQFRENTSRGAGLKEKEIIQFLNIVKKGNFIDDVSYPWLDNVKTWHNRETVSILSGIVRDNKLEIDLRLNAGQILSSIDPLNEAEFKYYLKLLHKNEKLSLAAYVYEKFCNEYESIFGGKYKMDLNDIVSKNS